MYPASNIPVFQLSIDYTKPAAFHYALACEMHRLRNRGLLIVGSGNIVHNLGMVNWSIDTAKPYDWSLEFDERVKLFLNNHDHQSLINYEKLGKAAQLSVPTNDHYLPMLYTIGLQQKNESVTYLYEGIEMGSISMRCFMLS
jgi:4,5-DOPA dioxygenase extradiol